MKSHYLIETSRTKRNVTPWRLVTKVSRERETPVSSIRCRTREGKEVLFGVGEGPKVSPKAENQLQDRERDRGKKKLKHTNLVPGVQSLT